MNMQLQEVILVTTLSNKSANIICIFTKCMLLKKQECSFCMSSMFIQLVVSPSCLQCNILTGIKTIGLVWITLHLMVHTLNGTLVNRCLLVTQDGGSKHIYYIQLV